VGKASAICQLITSSVNYSKKMMQATKQDFVLKKRTKSMGKDENGQYIKEIEGYRSLLRIFQCFSDFPFFWDFVYI